MQSSTMAPKYLVTCASKDGNELQTFGCNPPKWQVVNGCHWTGGFFNLHNQLVVLVASVGTQKENLSFEACSSESQHIFSWTRFSVRFLPEFSFSFVWLWWKPFFHSFISFISFILCCISFISYASSLMLHPYLLSGSRSMALHPPGSKSPWRSPKNIHSAVAK